MALQDWISQNGPWREREIHVYIHMDQTKVSRGPPKEACKNHCEKVPYPLNCINYEGVGWYKQNLALPRPLNYCSSWRWSGISASRQIL